MPQIPCLAGRVALVTGASQGVGRGIACVLGDAGATVYFTGRNPAALESVAAEITKRGGRGIGIACDHVDDGQVEALFKRIQDEQDGIDLLGNNIWGGYEA